MSIELNKQQINITDDSSSAFITSIAESDIIVPDAKPDALRILEVDAGVQIDEKYISKDYITLAGNINYRILYVGDGDENPVETISYSAPFSRQLDAAGADDTMTCIARCAVSHVEYGVLNSRKLNVKAAVNIDAHVYKTDEVSVVAGIESETALPSKSDSVNSFSMALCSENIFDIEETVKIPSSDINIDEILKYSMKISEPEVKVVINKIVAKGNLILTTLYRSEGEIYSAESEIPYTNIADIDGISPDMYTVAEYDIRNTSCDRALDDDGTMSLLNVRADIAMTLRAFDEKSVEYISDVYSPDYDISVKSDRIPVTEMIDTSNGQCTVTDIIESEKGRETDRVYCASAKAFVRDTILSDSSVTINGYINASVLVHDSIDGGMFGIEKQIPFSHTMSVARNYDSHGAEVSAKVNTEHLSYSIEGSGDVRLRAVVNVSSFVTRKHFVNAVTDVECDENKKIDKSTQAGITVYFVQDGDDLWGIAKRYHTTADEINTVNNLDGQELLRSGQQLLIPKRGK